MTDRSRLAVLLRYHAVLVRAVVVLVATLVLIASGVVPMWGRLREVRGEIDSKSGELEQMSQRAVILNSLDDQVLRDRVVVLDAVLPPSKDVVAYLTALDGLSRDFGLSLGGVSLTPGELATGSASAKQQAPRQSALSSLETEVRILGAAESLYGLLRQVEETAPLMLIKDVQMNRVGSGSTFLLTLRLSMLYADPLVTGALSGVVSLFTPQEEVLFERVKSFNRYVLSSSVAEGPLGKSDLFAPGSISPDQSSLPEESPEESPGPQESPSSSPSAAGQP